MARTGTREDLLPSKDVVFTETGTDGEEREIKFKIYKMAATEAESWLGEVIAMALRCGIPLPRSEGAFDEAMMRWAGDLAQGTVLLKLQGLDFNEVQRVMNMLFKHVKICLVDPHTGNVINMISATPSNINNHVSSYKTVFKLRLEVIGFTYGFFDSVLDLTSKVQDLQSASKDTSTSPPSLVRSLAAGGQNS